MEQKTNDWVAALLNRPDFNMVDMYANGVRPDNTGIQDRDYYKNIPQVQEQFTGENGQFDENKYNEFYDSALRMFNAYSDGDFIDKMLNSIERSADDFLHLDNQNVRDVSVTLRANNDPYHRQMGMGNIFQIGDPQYSIREVAQTQKVQDKNGNELDWSPNERGGLFKGLFRPTVALAVYDEDGYHTDPYGNQIYHQKGEYKFNDSGNPFYQEVEGDEAFDKEILRYSDTLTIEGTFFNRFDPFDSDGIDKSIGSTIAQTALKLAPFVAGPTVAGIAGGVYAIFGLASVLPVLGKIINGLADTNENKLGQALNKWDNYMERFAPTKSDKGKASFWNFENLADVVATSASQLYSQRWVGNIPKMLAKDPKLANSKIGSILGIGYMATTSAEDTYDQYRAAGANEETAGIATIATMAAFYAFMNHDYFKKNWMPDWMKEDVGWRDDFRHYMKQQSKKVTEDLATTNNISKTYNALERANNQYLTKLFPKITEKIKKTVDKIKPQVRETAVEENGKWNKIMSGYLKRGLNEGIEETMEEGVTDIIKGLTKGVEALGVDVSQGINTLDFGWSAEDFLARYSTAFVGGAIGGAVFEGLMRKDRILGSQTASILDRDLKERIYWYAMMGYGDQMLDEIDRAEQKGVLGNSNLSWEVEEFIDSQTGNKTKIFKQGTAEKNQNTMVANMLRITIRHINEIVKQENLYFGNNQIYQESVKKILEQAQANNQSLEDYSQQHLMSPVVQTLLKEDLLNFVTDDAIEIGKRIIDITNEIEVEKSKSVDSDKEAKESDYIKSLEKEKKELKKRLEEIRNGENLSDYIESSLFMVTPQLYNFYINTGFDAENFNYLHDNVSNYVMFKYHLNFDKLGDEQKKFLKKEYEDFKKYEVPQKLRKAQRIHSILAANITPILENAKSELAGVKFNPTFLPITAGSLYTMQKDAYETAEKKLQNAIEEGRKNDPNFESTPEFTELNNKLLLAQTQLLSLEPIKKSLYLEAGVAPKNTDLQFIDLPINTDADRENYMFLALNYYQNMVDKGYIYEGEKVRDIIFNKLFQSLTPLQIPTYSGLRDKIVGDYIAQFPGDDIEAYTQMRQDLINKGIISDSQFQGVLEGDLDPLYIFLQEQPEALTDNELEKAILKETSVSSVLSEKINALVNSLKENPKEILTAYDDLSTFLTSKGVSNPEETINTILGSKDILPFVNDFVAIENKIKKFDPIELLKQMELNIHGYTSNIWDLLKQEEAIFSLPGKKIEDYVIESDYVKKGLENASELVNLIIAQVSAATDGYNKLVNSFRDQSKTPLLSELEKETGDIIVDKLALVKSKIDTLLDLAKNHTSTQWQEQKEATIANKPKFIKALLNNFNLASTELPEDLNLKTIWDEVNIENLPIDGITEINYPAFDKTVRRFEKLVYDKFKNVDKKVLIKALLDSLDGTMFNNEYTKDKTVTPSTLDTLMYFLSIVTVDPEQYLSYYKAAAEANINKIIPFGGQELIIKMGFSKVLNESLYNTLLKGIKDKFNDSDDAYLKARSIFYNALFVDGNGGVGKSSAISYMLLEVLKAAGYKPNVFITAKSEQRRKGLQKTLAIPDSRVLDSALLFKSVYPKYGDLKDTNVYHFANSNPSKTGHFIQFNDYTLETIDSSKTPFLPLSDKELNILIVDEGTMYNESEGQMLSKIAQDKNVSIIYLGNRKQNAARTEIVYDGVPAISRSGIEDGIIFSTPVLKGSLRNYNRGKNINKDKVESLLETSFLNKLKENPSLELKELNGNSYPLELQYYADESGWYGEMEIEENQIDSTINEIKRRKSDATIAVVTNQGINKYDFKDGITVTTVEDVQGSEYDYVILDVDFHKESLGANNKDLIELLFYRTLYTMITRSKQATFFVKNPKNTKLFKDYKVSFKENKMSAIPIISITDELAKQGLEEYKKWRMDLLSDVTSINLTEPTSIKSGESESSEATPGSFAPLSTNTPSHESVEEEVKRQIETIKTLPTSELTEIDKVDIVRADLKKYVARTNALVKYKSIDLDAFIDGINNGIYDEDIARLFDISSDEINSEHRAYHSRLVLSIFSKLNNPEISNYIIDSTLKDSFISTDNNIDTLTNTIIENLSKENIPLFVKSQESGSSIIYFYFKDENSRNNSIKYIPIATTKNVIRDGFIDNLTVKKTVGHVKISSHGKIFIPLNEVLQNKAILHEELAVFKPGAQTKFDESQESFKYNNIGKTEAVISDEPTDLGLEILNPVYDVVSNRVKQATQISDSETSPTSIFGVQKRAENIEDFVKILKAKLVFFGQLSGNKTEAEETLKSWFGKDCLDGFQLNNTANKEAEQIEAAQNNFYRNNIQILSNDSYDKLMTVLLMYARKGTDDNDFKQNILQSFLFDTLSAGIESHENALWTNKQKHVVLKLRSELGFPINIRIMLNNMVDGKAHYDIYYFPSPTFNVNDSEEISKEYLLNTLEYDSTINIDPITLAKDVLAKINESEKKPFTLSKEIRELINQTDNNVWEKAFLSGKVLMGIGIQGRRVFEDENGDHKIAITHFKPFEENYFGFFIDSLEDSVVNSNFTDFQKYLKESEMFKYGLFLNIGSHKNSTESKTDPLWSASTVTREDGIFPNIVTDIIKVLAPVYEITNDDLAPKESDNSELQNAVWNALTGKRIEQSINVNSMKGIGMNIQYDSNSKKFFLNGEAVEYLGNVNNKYYFWNNNKGQNTIYSEEIPNLEDEIKIIFEKDYKRQTPLGFLIQENQPPLILFNDNSQLYFQTFKDNGSKTNVRQLSVNNDIVEVIDDNGVVYKFENTNSNILPIFSNNFKVTYDTPNVLKFTNADKFTNQQLSQILGTPIFGLALGEYSLVSLEDNVLTLLDETGNMIQWALNETQVNMLKENIKPFISDIDRLVNANIQKLPKSVQNGIIKILNNKSLKDVEKIDQVNEYLREIAPSKLGILYRFDLEKGSFEKSEVMDSEMLLGNFLLNKIKRNSKYKLSENAKVISVSQNWDNSITIKILDGENSRNFEFIASERNKAPFEVTWTYRPISEVKNTDSLEDLKNDINNNALLQDATNTVTQTLKTFLLQRIEAKQEGKVVDSSIRQSAMSWLKNNRNHPLFHTYMSYSDRLVEISNKTNCE